MPNAAAGAGNSSSSSSSGPHSEDVTMVEASRLEGVGSSVFSVNVIAVSNPSSDGAVASFMMLKDIVACSRQENSKVKDKNLSGNQWQYWVNKRANILVLSFQPP